MPISASERYAKKRADVLNLKMAYVEAGTGDPIVFLHGNPTSSYLWRNVIPHVEDLGRCIAPDLIGMGDSDKLPRSGPERYRFTEHRQYLDILLEQIQADRNVVLVLHDWGTALGFDWARRHPERVKGIAYMEGIVQPYSMAEFTAQFAEQLGKGESKELIEVAEAGFKGLRSSEGEKMILEDNMFVEFLLPSLTIRKLNEEEMAAYRRPFLNPGEDRRPTLTWPREIPLDGEPADVVEIVEAYGQWLSECDVPKLLIRAEPGAAIRGKALEFCQTWPNQTEVTVPGLHFIQEDHPDEVGQAIASWYQTL
ncbi:MAG: haloalkane dehalogenase [Dehalococcoidia bacterium]